MPASDHSTFARFQSIHFAPCSKRILAEISNALFDPGEISGKTIFIDGTKIEACANRYTFVWKKAVTKNQTELLIKLADFVAECEQLSYIKPANYEKSKTRKYKNDIGKIKNREYDIESDNYICKNKKNPVADHIRHSKTKTGYISEKTICESLLKKNICCGIMEKMGYIPEILMEKKEMHIIYRDTKNYTSKDLQELFRLVGWLSANYPERLKKALDNSETVFTAWDGKKLVGLVNAIDDSELTAYVHYLCVNPEYQGQGIGKNLLQRIKKKYKDYLYIILIAENEDLVKYYNQNGFEYVDGRYVFVVQNE